jgi:hypothetical protein
LERKLQFVALWMHNIQLEEVAKRMRLRQLGAVRQIICSFRNHRIRVFLKRLVFWHKMEQVIAIQRRFRGFMQRKRYKKMVADTKRRELRKNKAAKRIQTVVRRFTKHSQYLKYLQKKSEANAARYEKKRKLLEQVG